MDHPKNPFKLFGRLDFQGQHSDTIQTFAQMKLEILEFAENGEKKNIENVEVPVYFAGKARSVGLNT